jgi:hypothetical protein
VSCVLDTTQPHSRPAIPSGPKVWTVDDPRGISRAVHIFVVHFGHRRNPGLVQRVSLDGSPALGLRSVRSLLRQFHQTELRELRPSAIEWVFGLTGEWGGRPCSVEEVNRKKRSLWGDAVRPTDGMRRYGSC